MQNQFNQPGLGRMLRSVEGLTGNVVSEDFVIEPGGVTECVAAHDGQELLFYFEPTDAEEESGSGSGSGAESGSGFEGDGNVYIDRMPQDFSAYDEYDLVDMTGLSSYSWSAGETLLGNYRVRNATDQPLRVWTNNSLQ